MRLRVLWTFGLVIACQPVDSASVHPHTPDLEPLGPVAGELPGELPDEPGWTDAEYPISLEVGGPVAGDVPVGEQKVHLFDSLVWPGPIEGTPPWSVFEDWWLKDNNRLTWCLRTPSSTLPVSETRLALRAAAAEWSSNAGFVLREVECASEDECHADIEIEFLSESDPDYDEVFPDDGGSVLGYAFVARPGWWDWLWRVGRDCSQMYFDDERWWTLSDRGDGYSPPYDLQSVALHEFGHAFGLCHSYNMTAMGELVPMTSTCTDPTDTSEALCPTALTCGTGFCHGPVMCPIIMGSVRTLAPDDIEAIHVRYGPSEGVCHDGYTLAYEAYNVIDQAWIDASRLHEDVGSEPAYEVGADELERALDYAGKLEAAAYEAMATDPGYGLVATRYLYEVQSHIQAGIDAYSSDDPKVNDIVRYANDALNVLPVIYELEDYCYVLEYGEHEEGE